MLETLVRQLRGARISDYVEVLFFMPCSVLAQGPGIDSSMSPNLKVAAADTSVMWNTDPLAGGLLTGAVHLNRCRRIIQLSGI